MIIQQIDKRVADAFQIIFSSLLIALVCAYTCIPWGSDHSFFVSEGNMLPILLFISFRQAEIDEEQHLALTPQPHYKVFRFYVAMDDGFFVDCLYPLQCLVHQHKYRFNLETSKNNIKIYCKIIITDASQL